MKEEKVGTVDHYFTDIGVAAIKVEDETLRVGDRIHIKGETTDFKQVVDSMQVDHESVDKVEPGSDVGIKVKSRVREGDTIFKVSD